MGINLRNLPELGVGLLTSPRPLRSSLKIASASIFREYEWFSFSKSDLSLYTGWFEHSFSARYVSKDDRRVLERILELHLLLLSDQGAHHRVSSELVSLISQRGLLRTLNSFDIFTLSRAFQNIGLFVASGKLDEIGKTRFQQELAGLGRLRRNYGLAQLAIQRGDASAALVAGRALSQIKITSRVPKIAVLLRYIQVWTGQQLVGSTDFAGQGNQKFSEIVRGKKVLALGPGPMASSDGFDSSECLVARVMAPGPSHQAVIGEVGPERTDLIFGNKHTTRWLQDLPLDRMEKLLDGFLSFTSTTSVSKVTEGSAGILVRVAENPGPCLIYGKANSGSILLFDLLVHGTDSVYLKGFTFFLGAETYRPDQRRYYESTGRTSSANMKRNEDQRFEACHTLGSHGPLENRRIIKNLFDARRLAGDAKFRNAMLLSDKEYLECLDRDFGVRGL